MKGGGLNKRSNKPRYDKPQSRAITPKRVQSRAGQFGRRSGKR